MDGCSHETYTEGAVCLRTTMRSSEQERVVIMSVPWEAALVVYRVGSARQRAFTPKRRDCRIIRRKVFRQSNARRASEQPRQSPIIVSVVVKPCPLNCFLVSTIHCEGGRRSRSAKNIEDTTLHKNANISNRAWTTDPRCPSSYFHVWQTIWATA